MSEKSETLVKKLLEEVKASSSGELRLPLRRLLWATITADKSDAEKKCHVDGTRCNMRRKSGDVLV